MVNNTTQVENLPGNSGFQIPSEKKSVLRGKLAWLKNKYLLAGTFFLVWMLFFDPKDISAEMGRWKKFRDLKSSELQLSKKINDTRSELGDLKNNAQTIEKYAREKYLMKKDNEDLFIVPDSKTVKP